MMTSDTARELIASSRPRRSGLRGSTLILLGLSILLGALWADPRVVAWRQPLGWVLPQLLLLLVIGLLFNTAVRQKRLSRLMESAFEAVQLRQWPAARERLVQLLRHPINIGTARAEALLALAAAEEYEGAYGTSQSVYEAILEERAGDALQQHNARVALAVAMLRNGQITDAVNLIDRLERSSLPDGLRAQLEIVCLFREVMMGQPDASPERTERRRRLFRDHLGTRAAYGYALLAAAQDRLGQADSAAASWRDATLLLRPTELLRRFGELEPVAGKYPPAEWPW